VNISNIVIIALFISWYFSPRLHRRLQKYEKKLFPPHGNIFINILCRAIAYTPILIPFFPLPVPAVWVTILSFVLSFKIPIALSLFFGGLLYILVVCFLLLIWSFFRGLLKRLKKTAE
jgi:hypothetical protein